MWEDSNLGYDVEGFSIHELYRDLSPRQGSEWRNWELGRAIRLFPKAKKRGEKKTVARRLRSILKQAGRGEGEKSAANGSPNSS